MPSKMQASLAAGKPVFVHAAGDAAALVREAGCGWAVAPGDVAAGVDTVKAGLKMPEDELAAMGAAGRLVLEQRFSVDVGARRLGDAITVACQT